MATNIIFEYTKSFDGKFRHTRRMKTLSGLLGRIGDSIEPSNVEEVIVYDIVPVFTGKNYKEVEDFIKSRGKVKHKKPTRKDLPDSIINPL